MKPETLREVEALEGLTVVELREKYAEVFGEPTRSRHKRFLIKRVTWGLQARDEGGISERARRRAEELARESDLRLLAPKGKIEVHSFKPKPPDSRIPLCTSSPRGPMFLSSRSQESVPCCRTIHSSRNS